MSIATGHYMAMDRVIEAELVLPRVNLQLKVSCEGSSRVPRRPSIADSVAAFRSSVHMNMPAALIGFTLILGAFDGLARATALNSTGTAMTTITPLSGLGGHPLGPEIPLATLIPGYVG